MRSFRPPNLRLLTSAAVLLCATHPTGAQDEKATQPSPDSPWHNLIERFQSGSRGDKTQGQVSQTPTARPDPAGATVTQDATPTGHPANAREMGPIEAGDKALRDFDFDLQARVSYESPARPGTTSINDSAGRGGDGDTATAQPVELTASVSMSRDDAQMIHLDRNASAVIDLNAKIDKVEVASDEILEVYVESPTRLIVTGKGYGLSQMVVWSGSRRLVFDVMVEMGFERLSGLIRSAAPTANVDIHSVNGQLVLTGSVADAQTAERIVELANLYQGGEVTNQMQVTGVQQVMLEVVFAEVSKDATRQLGINWGFGASPLSRDFFFANNLGQLNPTIFSGSGANNVLTGQPVFSMTPNGNGPGVNFTLGFPRIELQLFLNALRENGLARTLAEPNLVAYSGKTASFLAGGEVPVPVAQGGAVAGAITIEYKEFGIRLEFTPVVIGQQVIRMDVMTEVSNITPGTQVAGGLTTFALTTRRVESTVECGNGESFAIAGLMDEQVRAIVSRIPGIGDVPILGALFSSVQYQKSTTELVVLVTPHLVQPLNSRGPHPLPGDGIPDPNDLELFALQQMVGGSYKAPKPIDGPSAFEARESARNGETAVGLMLDGPWGVEDR